MLRRAQREGYRGKTDISLFAFRTKRWFGGSNSIELHVFYRLLRYAFRVPEIDPSGPGGAIAARTPRSHVACFLGPIATRAVGVARGPSRGYRGSPGVARRLPEDPILIRTVKRVASEVQVRQNIVNLHISQGVPKGAPEGPM